eukprot:9866743-Lingulodinium_polyedra.AAC.1
MKIKDCVGKVCAPLRVVEVWDRLMRKRYGTVRLFSPAYARLLDRLAAPGGLKVVVSAMAAGI